MIGKAEPIPQNSRNTVCDAFDCLQNAIAADGSPMPNEHEIAITADFQPQETWLKGLWLRVRYADGSRGSDAADRRDVRIILNYNLSALR